MSCELCQQQGGELLWNSALCRVVLIGDNDYPGFCRVVLNRHQKEMTDLPVDERSRLMQVVFAVESALRNTLNPEKINLASFGNMTPHIHWHVIPRFSDDRHFPQPIWGTEQRPGTAHSSDALAQQLRQQLHAVLGENQR